MHKLFLNLNVSYPARRFLYPTLWNPRLLSLVSYFRSSSTILASDSKFGSSFDEEDEIKSAKQLPGKTSLIEKQSEHIEATNAQEMNVRVSHPWPEWVALMELLFKQGYFAGGRNPFRSSDLGAKELNCIRTACLNFARVQHDLIRSVSRKDIQIITGCGCPSLDRKVVNSGKRLRVHVGIDEGSVCGSCNLRGECERAYVKAEAGQVARTVDVMCVLLMYGLDRISSMLESKACVDKVVKDSVRRLLKELVNGSHLSKLSEKDQSEPRKDVPMKEGDWLCPNCNFLNFSKNVKCLRCDGVFVERLRKLYKDLDHLPLKKGDWICDKCRFLNFAKNSRCLKCEEKPRNRRLNPGEWECQSCNYINFRKNMVCLRCDHRRGKGSKDSNIESCTERTAVHSLFKSRFGRSKSDTMGDVKNDAEEGSLISQSGMYGLADFPILGGKSDLSRCEERREKWKEEARRKGSTEGLGQALEKEEELGLPCSNIEEEFEMAGWFVAAAAAANLKKEMES